MISIPEIEAHLSELHAGQTELSAYLYELRDNITELRNQLQVGRAPAEATPATDHPEMSTGPLLNKCRR